MAEERHYTISQLAEIAGVTPRTIRYYTAEGLLPRPDARGQYALYGEEHLLRLRLIGWLKQAYLPLGEIKARIEQLDREQIRALLEEYPEPGAAGPSGSAADYLAQLRARQQLPQAPQRMAERAESYIVAERPSMSLRQPKAPDQPPPAAPVYGFAAPLASPVAEPARIDEPPAEPRASEGPAAVAPQQAGLLRKLIPPRRNAEAGKSARAEAAPTANRSAAEERWRRVELAPGVELHVREPAAEPLRERIEQLIALGRSLFESRD